VAVINRTLARQLFGDDDPIGWQLAGVGSETQIIGVAEDARDPGPDQEPRPMIYRPTLGATNLLIRSHRENAVVANLLRSAAAAIDPEVRLLRIEPMSEILDRALAGRRFQLTLLATFALTALVLACVGIYGVLSYSVERQSREIGVRMALGARAGGVATRIAWRGGQLAVLGVLIGAGGAYGLRQTIASQLFDVESFDPLVYLGVSGILLATATLACLIPARRAAIIDPVRALHTE
jgi:putative ABC transport system permease protein